ncbi:hypothetical protein FH609_012895 [Streptomyces sp. 3MP-14]|uniref:Uncharacterized protein n=1 Tax=Streptomyces mimosae TaxID=2586635 RepID=A0A5N6AHH6_9ACTN|nr:MULTISPECIES: hypothetical protein [Streptomyces]KAB8167269.1 hypothetical protein FH607_010345 [Streptomyces mimosae]KAB8177209.1 hypothetical protein FH609_012895 [Streptomyces sp. 3MP-14]
MTEIELPLGPACGVHGALRNLSETPGQELITGHLDYFVCPPPHPRCVVRLSITWASPAVALGIHRLAEALVHSLTAEPLPTGSTSR